MDKNTPDKDLIADFLEKQGHSLLAFQLLVERYEKIVFSTIYRYIQNSELAEELTQDTFLSVYNNLRNLENKSAFKSWLMRIAKNISLDHLRAAKNKNTTPIDNLEELAAPTLEIDPVASLITALQQLDTDEQDLISLHYFSGLSIKEISEMLDVGESAIKMRLMRTREKLEKMIAKQ